LFAVLVVLISANTRTAKLDGVVGSTHASLVWVILAAAVLGWLLGITTAVVFRQPNSSGALTMVDSSRKHGRFDRRYPALPKLAASTWEPRAGENDEEQLQVRFEGSRIVGLALCARTPAEAQRHRRAT
jgi:hypothetical protein